MNSRLSCNLKIIPSFAMKFQGGGIKEVRVRDEVLRDILFSYESGSPGFPACQAA